MNGLITSMNDALEEKDSKYRLIEISERTTNPTDALLKKGRILYEEDDVDCLCSEPVGDEGMK